MHIIDTVEKCPYLGSFWTVFSRIWTEYVEIHCIPYSVRMRENTDQNNSKHGHFLHCVNCFHKNAVCADSSA